MTNDQGAEPAIRDSENRAIGARYKLTNSCATWKRLHVIYFKFSAAHQMEQNIRTVRTHGDSENVLFAG